MAPVSTDRALREAFVTPLEPEDLFALSRGVDRILNQAKDLVRESEVMVCPPDAAVAQMAALLVVSAMAALLEVDNLREVLARRELYRRCSRMGEAAVDVAERILSANVKES
jgi:uncharacterized protein Yka (UPF0111/DUF47 family)